MGMDNGFTENQIFSMADQFDSGLGSPKVMRSLSPKERFSHVENEPEQVPLSAFENHVKFFEDRNRNI